MDGFQCPVKQLVASASVWAHLCGVLRCGANVLPLSASPRFCIVLLLNANTPMTMQQQGQLRFWGDLWVRRYAYLELAESSPAKIEKMPSVDG